MSPNSIHNLLEELLDSHIEILFIDDSITIFQSAHSDLEAYEHGDDLHDYTVFSVLANDNVFSEEERNPHVLLC
jgi:hypothetical protein